MSFWHDPEESTENNDSRLKRASSLTDLEAIADKSTDIEVDGGHSNSAEVGNMGERISNILHRTYFTEQEKLLRGEPVTHPVLNSDIRREESHTHLTGELSNADQQEKSWNEYFDMMMSQLADGEDGHIVGSPSLPKNDIPEFGETRIQVVSDVECSSKGRKNVFGSVDWGAPPGTSHIVESPSLNGTSEFFRNYEDSATDSDDNDDFDYPKKSVLMSMGAKPFLGDDSSQYKGGNFSRDMFRGGHIYNMKRVSSMSQIDRHHTPHSGPCLLPMPTACDGDLNSLLSSIPPHAWILPYVVVGAIVLSEQRKDASRGQQVGGVVSFRDSSSLQSSVSGASRTGDSAAAASASFPTEASPIEKLSRDDIGMHSSPHNISHGRSPHKQIHDERAMGGFAGNTHRRRSSSVSGDLSTTSFGVETTSPPAIVSRNDIEKDSISRSPDTNSSSPSRLGASRLFSIGRKREEDSTLDDSHYRDKETSMQCFDDAGSSSDNSTGGHRRRFLFGHRSYSKEDSSLDDSHFHNKEALELPRVQSSDNDIPSSSRGSASLMSMAGSPPLGILSGLISRMRHSDDNSGRDIEKSVHGDLVLSHDEFGVYLTSKPDRFNSDSALYAHRENEATETTSLPTFMQHLFVFPNFVALGTVFMCKTNPGWGEWFKRRLFLWDNFIFEASPENEGIPIGFANMSGALVHLKSDFSSKGEWSGVDM